MTVEALRRCREKDLSFEDTFRFQYIIDRDDLSLPGFVSYSFNGWILQAGAVLPVVPIRDGAGTQIGLFFGIGAHHDGTRPEEAIARGLAKNGRDARAQFEAIVTETVGRFGVLIELEGQLRLYTDASGTIGAVVNRKLRRIAASCLLCVDRPIDPNPLYSRPNTNREVEFGFSHTPDRHVTRINCNHFLDLESFQTSRFWPNSEDQFELPFDSYGAALDEILRSTRNVLTSLNARYTTSLPLTGGLDSRIIFVAAGEEGRAGFSQIYTYVLRSIGRMDAAIARQLCSTKGLSHEMHLGRRPMHRNMLPATEKEREKAALQYSLASGVSGHPKEEVTSGIYSLVDQNAVVLRGQQIPILRALFVDTDDPDDFTDEYFQTELRRLLSYNPPNRRADKRMSTEISAYLQGVPGVVAPKKADLIYYEVVNAPELAANFGGNFTSFYVSPFNSRRLIQLMMSFDTSYRRRRMLFWHLLMRADPEVAGIGSMRFVKGLDCEEETHLAWRSGFIEAQRLLYEAVFREDCPEVPVTPFTLDVLSDEGHLDLPNTRGSNQRRRATT